MVPNGNGDAEMLPQMRASKPGNLLSVIPCPSFGLRPQVEFRGKKKTAWALEAIKTAPYAVALIDSAGTIVACSATYPR